MKKKKVILLAAAGVAVVLLLVAGFLLYRGIVKLNDVQTQLKSASGELDRLYARNPFPCEDNVKIERENAELLALWKQKLHSELRRDQIVPDREKSPSAFISMLQEKVRQLTARANPNPDDETTHKVAENFAFGFGRYFTEDAARPDQVHVSRLTQQLLVVEGLTLVLLEEEVDRIVDIAREEFETDKADMKDVGAIGETNLFAKFHFTFEVQVKEEPLLNIMNRLARHDQFVVVTGVKVSKSTPDVRNAARLVDDEEDEEDEDGLFRPAAPKGQIIVGSNKLTRAQRLVCGLELEEPMTATLDVDVYWFGIAKVEAREGKKDE